MSNEDFLSIQKQLKLLQAENAALKDNITENRKKISSANFAALLYNKLILNSKIIKLAVDPTDFLIIFANDIAINYFQKDPVQIKKINISELLGIPPFQLAKELFKVNNISKSLLINYQKPDGTSEGLDVRITPFEINDRTIYSFEIITQKILSDGFQLFRDLVKKFEYQIVDKEIEIIKLREVCNKKVDRELQFQIEKETNEIFNKLLASFHDRFFYVIRFDTDELPKLQPASPSIKNVTGFDKDDFKKMNWIELVHPQDILLYQTAKKNLSNQHYIEIEYRIIDKNGRVVWVKDSMAAGYDPERGYINYIVGFMQDVTENLVKINELDEANKRLKDKVSNEGKDVKSENRALKTELAELKRRSSELQNEGKEIKTLFENIFQYSLIHSKGIILDINKKLESFLGYSKWEVINKPVSELIQIDALDIVSGKLQNSTSEPFRIVFHNNKKRKLLAEAINLKTIEGENPIYALMLRKVSSEEKYLEYENLILEILDLFHDSKDINEAISSIYPRISSVIGTQNFGIAYVDENERTVNSIFHEDEFGFVKFPYKLKKGIIEYVYRRKETVLLNENDIQKIVEKGELKIDVVRMISFIGVPFRVKGRLNGILYAQHYIQTDNFDKSLIKFMEILASLISNLIHFRFPVKN